MSSSFVHFKNGLEYLTRGWSRCLFLWWDFCYRAWFSEVFLFYGTLFLFFSFIYDGFRFQYSRILIIFLLSRRYDAFLIWRFCSFCHFTFSTFHYQHGTFFNTKFHSYKLVVYSYCLNQGLLFFFIFCKYLDIIDVRWLILFDYVVNLKPTVYFLIQWHHCYNKLQWREWVSLEDAILDLHRHKCWFSCC